MANLSINGVTIATQSGTDNAEIIAKSIAVDNSIEINSYQVLHDGTFPTTTDSILMSPDASVTIQAGAVISNWRVMEQTGDGLTASSDRVTINRAGTYLVIQSFLFNTSTQGSNGDTRIRLNGVDIVAGYALGTDTANWEKSVGTMVVYCNVDDYIDVKAQSVQYIWGSSSGSYSHSPFVVVRIGT
jgi:hypothetical protein